MDECTEAEKLEDKGTAVACDTQSTGKQKITKILPILSTRWLSLGFASGSLFHLHFHQPAVNPSTSRLARRKPPQEADYFPIPFELQQLLAQHQFFPLALGGGNEQTPERINQWLRLVGFIRQRQWINKFSCGYPPHRREIMSFSLVIF